MIQIQYQTQRLSLRFFLLMLVLLVFQVAAGMVLAAQQVDPTILSGVVNFNVMVGHQMPSLALSLRADKLEVRL